MLLKFKFTLTSLLILVLSNLTFAGSIPLNTGYDYSNFNIYSLGTNDNYWIRISSFPTLTVGPAWSVSTVGSVWAAPMAGSTGVPSTWINAFSGSNASPGGTTPQNPAYAIYRKCFCLPQDYRSANIQGRVRNDDSIQIWFNSLINQVLVPSQSNQTGATPPYNINYAIPGNRIGRNCLYVLLEDTGTTTGFNFVANLNTSGGMPLIAQGPAISFGSCSCPSGPLTFSEQADEQADADDREIIDQIVKIAEQNRIERANSFWPLEK